MLKKLIRNIPIKGKDKLILKALIAFLGIGLGMPLQSCHDELETEAASASGEEDEIEGDCIAFTMQLDKDISSRGEYDNSALDRFENYIDTQDQFRIFFFTEEGNFLFGATDRVVGSLNSTSDQNSTYYYVRIPMTMIVDRENQEYDIEKIKSYLKNNRFKIAVLANWPNGGEKINPADWDDSEGGMNSGDNPSSTLKGNPRWNWSNSILNLEANPSDIRNINDLHHVYNDLYYANATRIGSYGNFMSDAKPGDEAGKYMGEPTDWVKMRDIDGESWKANYPINGTVSSFDSKVTANQWIRANWSPEVYINHNKGIYRHYQHMWFLWNFDASYKTGDLKDNIGYEALDGSIIKGDENIGDRKKDSKGNYIVKTVNDASAYNRNWDWNDGNPYTDEDPTNRFGKDWYTRNGDILYQWMHASFNEGETAKAIGEKTIQIGEANNDVYFKYQAAPGEYAYCRKVGNNYGIQLPAIGEGQKVSYNGTMQFQARTAGTLRIKWGSYDGVRSGLAVQVGLPKDAGETSTDAITYKVHKGVTSTTPVDWTADGYNYLDITVAEGSRTVYISCTEGKAVVYAIEFIRGRYLYETDREGVAPSNLQGIPMYGVQNFEPISDWQRGTTINLDKKVSLIRALAKIEVHIKKDFGEPKHVYMRGMNRAARCEPMDVQTPTDKIWKATHDYSLNHDTQNCEWFRIMDYGPAYGKVSDDGYKDWLSWFYGSWQYKEYAESDGYETIRWKTSGVNADYRRDRDKGYYVPTAAMKGWNDDGGIYNYASDAPEPPHVFNPYMYRSDFCSFLKIDGETTHSDGNYYKYVLYVPEKNIDDPATVGRMSSDPKVPHIEYRFAPPEVSGDPDNYDSSAYVDDPFSNTEYNLDDNDCYRIYFTNYGGSTTGINGPINTELKDQNWWRYTYDEYERSNERLSKHWPIMRNHIYKLYVGGAGPENPEILVQVSDWNHRKVVLEW